MSRTLFGLLVVFALMLLFAGSAQAQLQGIAGEGRDLTRPVVLLPIWDDDNDSDPGGYGRKFAGSWLGTGEFSVDLGCDGTFDIGPIPVTDAHTFGLAGVHVTTNPANPNSAHGTWRKTGPRQVSSRDISFAVDTTPNGTVTTVAVVSMVVDFDPTFQTATTSFGADVYLPFQNPLDPAESPVACSQGYHTSFIKVNATE